jgi:hypothetical protein
MPTVYRVPPEYSSIRDEIVAHAVGEGPGPTDTEEVENFQNWLIYESPAAGGDDYECVIRLADLEFEDNEVRYEQDLPEDSPITNEQRLDYARRYIDSYLDKGRDDPYFAEAIELRRADGKSALLCCLTQMGGQSGLLPEWYGCYPNHEAFFDELRKQGWWVLKDPASGIPDDKLLDLFGSDAVG